MNDRPTDGRTALRAAAALTLTEMLVVLGILSVLLVVTVPFVSGFMRRGEMDQAVTIVQMSALRTRSLAVERREKYDLVLDARNSRVWARKTADAAKPLEDAIVGDVHALPGTVRMVLWRFPEAVTFAPSGGLAMGTREGFYLVGVTEYEGEVNAVGTDTLSVAGAPWSPDDRFRNYYVIFTSGDVKGQARLITASTDDTLTIQGSWSATEDPWKAPSGGDKFVIVSPDNIRHIMIYSTTGQAKAGPPPKGE